MSKSIGRIAGTVGGFVLGGPQGAALGYQLGSGIDGSNGVSQQGSLTQTTTPNTPAFVSQFQQDLFNRAGTAANQLGQRQFAGFSPLQQGVINNLSGLNQGFTAEGAKASEQAISGLASNPFLGGAINQYMNPYTQDVINASLSDIDRARQLQQQQVNANAISRGAFGGSRQAVAEAENNRNFLDQAARTSAGLRAQGYESALAAARADRDAQMNAYQLMNKSFLGNLTAQLAGGGMVQDLEQQKLDAARNLPLEKLQIMQSTLGNGQLPTGETSTRPLYGNNTAGLLGAVGSFAASNPQAFNSIGNFLTGIPSSLSNAYYNWNAKYGTPYGTSYGE